MSFIKLWEGKTSQLVELKFSQKTFFIVAGPVHFNVMTIICVSHSLPIRNMDGAHDPFRLDGRSAVASSH